MAATAVGPLVSVVIPTYGRPEYLVDAIQSVADQCYDPIEVVVVDDHSPQPVEPFLEATLFDQLYRTEVIRHEENKGANAARSTGINATEGELVAFLDDDDVWDPTYLERVVEAFEQGGPEVGVVLVGIRILNEKNEQINTVEPETDGDITEEILRGTVQAGSFSRFVVRRPVIDAAGLPDEQFPSWQDMEWQIRLSKHCRYLSISSALATRRYTTRDQITGNYQQKRDVSYPRMIEKHRELAASYGPDTERRFRATLTRTLGFSALRNGHYISAISLFLSALTQDPRDRTTYGYVLLSLGGPFTYGPAKRISRYIAGTSG